MSYNIAIDGPAGAGKSTIAKKIAKKMNYIYVDTGAMYRAMALYLIRMGVEKDDKEKIEEIGPVSDSRKSKTSSKEAREKAQECGYYPDVHFDWLAAVVDILDEDQALADFLQFLDENDIDNDLHSGNIGYKNGFPVLMDYAGFYD